MYIHIQEIHNPVNENDNDPDYYFFELLDEFQLYSHKLQALLLL